VGKRTSIMAKRKSLLSALKHVNLPVKIQDETHEVNPMTTHIPGIKVEKTEIGVAEIGGKKTVYIKMKLKGEL